MKKTAQEPKVTDNPLYHDTWMLLRKYRDVVWSLELSVQQVRRQFQIEYGSSIEEFLESLYVAGITFEGSAIEDHARCIERSYKMLKLLDTSVELLRTKHKYGESYYWLLYYTYLSPQQLANTQEIIEKLEPHIRDISYRTYFRKRQMAIDALSSVLWGYSSKESLALLEKFVPEADTRSTRIILEIHPPASRGRRIICPFFAANSIHTYEIAGMPLSGDVQ